MSTLTLDPVIRAEQPEDFPTIRAVNLAVFPTPFEADLVDRLRQRVQPTVSQVAVVDDTIVGHIFFSPVHISKWDDLKVMGLAPTAVLPAGVAESGYDFQKTVQGKSYLQRRLN